MARIPKYRAHSSRRFAFIEHDGQRIRLPGKFNSTESRRAYRAFLTKLLASPDDAEDDQGGSPVELAVVELVNRYLGYADGYYRGNSEYGCIADATAPLVARYGKLPVDQFGPRRLKRVRRIMVAGRWKDSWSSRRPWSRSYVNHQINRLRRMFRWGVSEEIVPAKVAQALAMLPPLRKGRPDGAGMAEDRKPVAPVDPAHVTATIARLAPPVRAMVELQQLTGMRSQNVTAMRPCDLDRSSEVWEYIPAEHKAAWLEKKLFIALGPRCQEILKPFLNRPPESFLFSPIEAQAWRSQQRRAARKTPLTPSQRNRAAIPLSKRERPPADRYTPASYRRAIRYGIRLANKAIDRANKKLPENKRKSLVPAWTPHQLRHNAATSVRRSFNAEGARVYLGHSHLKTTEIYAERDIELAREIALRMG